MPKVNMRMSYDTYIQEIGRVAPLEPKVYMDIVGGLFKFIFQLIIDGDDVRLSERLGNVGIRGRKQTISIDEETDEIKGLPIDWGTTTKYWKTNPEAKEKNQYIYHLNEHSNGVRYGFHWYKNESVITHITYYSMKLYKPYRQAINRAVKEGKDYLLIMKKEKKNART